MDKKRNRFSIKSFSAAVSYTHLFKTSGVVLTDFNIADDSMSFETGDDAKTTAYYYNTKDSSGFYTNYKMCIRDRGMDLITDLGYPPVHCGGGWLSPQVQWYASTASHNTVVIDGKDQPAAHVFDVKEAGHTTLWADGKKFHAMRFSGTKLYENSRQYERGVYVIDLRCV